MNMSLFAPSFTPYACHLSIIISFSQRIHSFVPTSQIIRISPTNFTNIRGKARIHRKYVQQAHTNALQTFLSTDAQCAFIFEEDIEPIYNVPSAAAILDKVPKDWQYINLGRCWSRCDRQIKLNAYIYKNDESVCRHAYVVTRTGARILLENTIILNTPGDVKICQMISSGLLFGYSSVPIYRQDRKTHKSKNKQKIKILECKNCSRCSQRKCIFRNN